MLALCRKFAQKWPLSYLQPILTAIIVTIATVKVKLIPNFYSMAIGLKNFKEDIGEKHFFLFLASWGGGQFSLLMHIALSCSVELSMKKVL